MLPVVEALASRDAQACGGTGVGAYSFNDNCGPGGRSVWAIEQGNSSYAVFGEESGQPTSSGPTFGVYGQADANAASGNEPIGVEGAAIGTSGIGVEGITSGSTAISVLAVSNGSTGVGVQGQANDTNGWGVYGYATGGATVGVYGVVSTTANSGANAVYGLAPGNSFPNFQTGVAGQISPAGYGNAIYGINNSSLGWAGDFVGNVLITGCAKIDGTAYGTCVSDLRLKKNIQALTGSLELLTKLRPVTYEWINPEEEQHKGDPKVVKGFIAQEVEKVMPGWVSVNDKGFKTLNTGELQVMLVDSVRTLKAENDALNDRVRALEGRPRLAAMGLDDFGGFGGFVSVGLLLVGGAFMVGRKQGQQGRV